MIKKSKVIQKNFFKSKIFLFIIGLFIFGTAGVYALVTFPSTDVSYDNSASGLASTNVQGAIDELYNTCLQLNPLDGTVFEDKIVTSGDGLYKDEFENRYFYRGVNPNNYITFNGELWRILSIEGDGRIKIISNYSIGRMPWHDSTRHINDWNRATLKTYLNDTYINTLSDKDKIVTSTWNIGGVGTNDIYNDYPIGLYIREEKSETWSGNVALITVSEYLRTINRITCGHVVSYCTDYTWISSADFWTLTSSNDNIEGAWRMVNSYGRLADINTTYSSLNIFPCVYLQSGIKITGGDGSENNPFALSL